jgi:hypothetical protein
MNPFFYSEEAGAKRLPPLSPAPQIPAQTKPSLHGRFQLTMPNTSCTIITPASLRSDCCSPSLRNAVRLPSGIDVHLHRNTHSAHGRLLRKGRARMGHPRKNLASRNTENCALLTSFLPWLPPIISANQSSQPWRKLWKTSSI